MLQHLPCSHPHEQKVKDDHISNELRQGRSAQWLTKRVQVANDGAILLTGKTYRNKQQLKRDREQGQRRSQLPRWPNSRPGSSGGDKSAPSSGVVVQRQQPRRKKKWSERVTFGKKYGRGITAGNVSGGPVLLVFCCVCCRRLMFVVFCCSLLFVVVRCCSLLFVVVLCCSCCSLLFLENRPIFITQIGWRQGHMEVLLILKLGWPGTHEKGGSKWSERGQARHVHICVVDQEILYMRALLRRS